MELIKLLAINYKFKLSKLVEQCKLLPYYSNTHLLKIDWLFFKNYLGQNPYHICKSYLEASSKSLSNGYGESWITQMTPWIHLVPITDQDVVYEVGCGTGQLCFWIQALTKCRVVGIEKVPFFVQKANAIKEALQVGSIEFLEEDFLKTNYDSATLIYFYGTSFSDESILKLLKNWKSLKKGTRILTTSFALSDYSEKNEYKIINTFITKYPWGTTNVFLQEKA